METKYQKEVKRIIYKAEIAQYKKENTFLMDEIKRNAGTIALLNRDKENLEKTLKAQISSTGELIQVQAKQSKRKDVVYTVLFIIFFALGFVLRGAL